MLRFGLMLFSVVVILALVFAVTKYRDEIIINKSPTASEEFVEHGQTNENS